MFSHVKISSVSVHINNDFLGDAQHVNGPLYVIKWNPAIYTVGLHKIEVSVTVKSHITFHINVGFHWFVNNVCKFLYVPVFML